MLGGRRHAACSAAAWPARRAAFVRTHERKRHDRAEGGDTGGDEERRLEAVDERLGRTLATCLERDDRSDQRDAERAADLA